MFFTKESELEYDFYTDIGLILGFDKNDLLEYIEIIKPSKAIYNNLDLLSLNKKVFEKIMKELTINTDNNQCDYHYPDLPLRAYAPYSKIESISIYKIDYYK